MNKGLISIPLLKRNLWGGFKLMLPFIAILTMYNTIIIWMYDPELSKSLEEFQKIMPEMMAAVGMTGDTGSLLQFMHTYLYGFIMLFIPIIYVVMLVSKLIMRDIDNGSVAILLATSNTRRKIVFTQCISIVFLSFLLIAVMTGIGYVCSEMLFEGELEVQKYLQLNGALFLLNFTISGISVLAACLFQEAKWYMSVGVGLPLIFYIIQMMANMGEKLEKFKYATIFTLFPGKNIVEGNEEILLPILVLAGLGFILYAVAQYVFCKRDFSV